MEDLTQSDFKSDNPKKERAYIFYKSLFGNIRQTCKKTGISRQTFNVWLKEDAEFKAAIDSIEYNEDITDAAEYEMMRRVKGYNITEIHTVTGENGYVKTIKKRVMATDSTLQFIVSTKGRKRGYHQEAIAPPSRQIVIQITTQQDDDAE